jgi:glycosyltransferase involved in cell wall biosynthesis
MGSVLTGMVICLDEARRIGACLESLAFCDEILVIDSGSKDGTIEIVKKTGARLIERPFVSWNDQKDFGRRESKHDWVLNVDADEVVSKELAQEIQSELRTVAAEVAAFRIPFRNYLRDTWIKSCGFYPDPHVRLVRRDKTRWDTSAVHDKLLVEGEVKELRGHIDHYSFESIQDYLEKSNIYAEAFAKDAISRGRTASAAKIVLHTLGRFFRSYFLRGGMFDGATGLVMSGLQAAGVFQKYVRLWEMQRFPEARPKEIPAELGDPWRAQRIRRS